MCLFLDWDFSFFPHFFLNDAQSCRAHRLGFLEWYISLTGENTRGAKRKEVTLVA